MFGYACDETPELMPLPISLAHRLAIQLAKVRHEEILNYLLPDGKTQVSIDYEKGLPVSINTILISTQHNPEIDGITNEEEIRQRIKEDLWTNVVIPATEDLEIKPNVHKTRFLVNPTGKFVVGGPQGDAGLTGRKIIVDTYGGYARHGGGAPPPCLAYPPYVSTIIFLPVRPASPCGPPTTNFPVGFTRNLVL